MSAAAADDDHDNLVPAVAVAKTAAADVVAVAVVADVAADVVVAADVFVVVDVDVAVAAVAFATLGPGWPPFAAACAVAGLSFAGACWRPLLECSVAS